MIYNSLLYSRRNQQNLIVRIYPCNNSMRGNGVHLPDIYISASSHLVGTVRLLPSHSASIDSPVLNKYEDNDHHKHYQQQCYRKRDQIRRPRNTPRVNSTYSGDCNRSRSIRFKPSTSSQQAYVQHRADDIRKEPRGGWNLVRESLSRMRVRHPLP